MERRRLGNTGIEVAVLGFGGSEIGFLDAPQADVDRILGEALDAGLNVIDTAECYIESETKIGNAVSHRRSDYALFTKVGHRSGLEGADWEPEMMAKSIDRSLVKLKTDHVDLVQLHSCSKELLEQGDVIRVLQDAKAAGKTRFIGYSGDHEAALWAVQSGLFDTLQTSVNIADQQAISTTLPIAAQKGIGVIVKRPVANVAWLRDLKESDYAWTYKKRLDALSYDFLHQGAEPSFETAFRFTLAQAISVAIVGTRAPGRWLENAKVASRGPLEAAKVAEILARWKEVAQPDWVGQQ